MDSLEHVAVDQDENGTPIQRTTRFSKLFCRYGPVGLALSLILDVLLTFAIVFMSSNGHIDLTTKELAACQPAWTDGPLNQLYVCRFASPDDTVQQVRRRRLVLSLRPTSEKDFVKNISNELITSGTEEKCQAVSSTLEHVLSGSSCLMTEVQFRTLTRDKAWIDLALFARRVKDAQQTEAK